MRPGDFNEAGDWADVLVPHRWEYVGGDGVVSYWSRPGKGDPGHSATTNYQGSDRLYVFSTNADPFEADRSYSKFEAYALLNFDGDFGDAARDLRELGYGRPFPVLPSAARRPSPYAGLRLAPGSGRVVPRDSRNPSLLGEK